MNPKSICLHELLNSIPADFFVCFPFKAVFHIKPADNCSNMLKHKTKKKNKTNTFIPEL